MADEHNAWLDRAAAEELLRAGTGPVAPGADPRARAEAARLRAALGSLTPPSSGAGELPGEAAALAAFRAARARRATAPGAVRAAAPGTGAARAGGAGEPLVDLAPIPPVRIPAQRRGSTAARFGLVAALAGVAVGGIAAAAGGGLLDRVTHHTAGPAPAVSVSADPDPEPAADTAGPTLVPQLRPTPERGGESPLPPGPGVSRPPGTDTRTLPDAPAAGLAQPSGAPTAGMGFGAGTDGSRDKLTDKLNGGAAAGGRDHDKGSGQGKAADLCEAYRSGRMNDDRRERLSKLAGAPAKIARFCEALLDGARDGLPQSGTVDPGNAILKVPSAKPGGALGFSSR
ncbi:hypothetical protein ACGFXC_11920 [Streptomyces sp. NPDC048507]|uniref:hypothetical protein n=1 Tax=Streptomyces sp. NPDC048507 TaxID=3365560 RepID=UPI00371D85E5